MPRYNLTDVTFLIPVRIDSPERMKNLSLTLEFIKNNFNTNITVLEADINERAVHRLVDNKIFIEDHDKIFHHTRYRNQMMLLSRTPYAAVWDIDIILPPEQIIKAYKKIRNKKADMVIPYDGRCYIVPPILKNIFMKKPDIQLFNSSIGKMNLMYGKHSVGGAFFINKSVYMAAGMENEKFYGWGPEDAERVKRMEILGYKIDRIEGPLFHLSHPRKENSRYANIEQEIQLKKEFLKVCQMNKKELEGYVQTWK